mmetsp:Transcript_2820/g.4062  ORF Transcript_2820/g.4062 Transcript_2820/m.4062 type:complete len:234 (-) Transcript_2820:647-1348(-)
MSDTEENQEQLYKVLVVGDYGVGKTAFIRRTCNNEFTNNYRITIGVDFSKKHVEYEDKNVTLQLWDIAGHERYGGLTRVYYKFAIAALVCFDISRPSTLDNVKKWREDINSKVTLPNEEHIPMILLANKCDLDDISIDEQKLSKFAKDNGFMAWFKCSAKDNININETIQYLVGHIVELSKTQKLELPNEKENNLSVLNEDSRQRLRRDVADVEGGSLNAQEDGQSTSRCACV